MSDHTPVLFNVFEPLRIGQQQSKLVYYEQITGAKGDKNHRM